MLGSPRTEFLATCTKARFSAVIGLAEGSPLNRALGLGCDCRKTVFILQKLRNYPKHLMPPLSHISR